MKILTVLLASACALGLAACSKSPESAGTTSTPTATPAESPPPATPAPASAASPTPVEAAAPAPAAVSAAGDKPAAVVSNCSTTIEGNDAMQYNVGSITVPASCTGFKITLTHTGKMPVAAMGHDVVITKAADMQAVAAEGAGAGLAANYLKPDDARVIAHTPLVGGGQTTSVSVPVSKIRGDGPYAFFCSFPGHSTVMKGTIAVE
ncbi:azurin [Cognatiluteimonas profundi]|uniref:azurin n=1 Tax=Cognatiluteimonas profundi TaxID=2594501 RepID=UPI00131ECAC8|nr:azurin [Lysobacter profundi]